MPSVNLSPIAGVDVGAEHMVQPLGADPHTVVDDPPGAPDDLDYLWRNNVGTSINGFSFADFTPDDADAAVNFLEIMYRQSGTRGFFENPFSMRPFVRKDGVNYFGTPTTKTFPTNVVYRWTMRPWDGFPWKPSDLKAGVLVAGIESTSALFSGTECYQLYMIPDYVLIGKLFTPVSALMEPNLESVAGHDIESVLAEASLAVSLKENLVSSIVEPQLVSAHAEHDFSVELNENEFNVELT